MKNEELRMQIKSCQTKNEKERWLLIKNFLSTIFCTQLNKTNRKALQVMRTHHALHLTPYTLRPTPHAPHLKPYVLHLAPYALHLLPFLHLKPYTVHLLPLPSAVSKVQRSFAFKICNFPQVG